MDSDLDEFPSDAEAGISRITIEKGFNKKYHNFLEVPIHLKKSSPRIHRKKSVSCPQNLNLLLEFAQSSWQQKPEGVKDYFDEVEQSKKAKSKEKERRPSRNLISYDPIRSDDEYYSQSEVDGDMSELSETESRSHSPAPYSGTSRKTLKFPNHRPSLAGIRSQAKRNDIVAIEDDEEIHVSKGSTNSRKISCTRPANLKDLDSVRKDGSAPSKRYSISSVSNLIRLQISKVSTTIPKVFRKKTSNDYKIQIFVALLSLTIILLVGSIYVIHQEKELQKAYFDRIRFSSKDRKIRIANLKGREVINGVLGTNLSKKDKPWQCLERDMRDSESCLEWMNIARLYFRRVTPRREWDQPNMQCYGIRWESLNTNYVPQDCFYTGEANGVFYFYGGGEMEQNQWPLSRASVPLVPFISGRKVDHKENRTIKFEWGQNLKAYFAIFPGSSLEVAKDVPLHISVNDEKHPKMLCLAAKADEFAYPSQIDLPNILDYTICTGNNMYEVHTALQDKDIWDGLKHSDVHATQAFSAIPTWRILPETINFGNLSESSLLNYTDRIASLLLSEGYLFLDETWQSKPGDFKVDPSRFMNIGETFNITRRRGFNVALTITPFVSTESINYVQGLSEGIWVMQKQFQNRKGPSSVPALTKHKSSNSVVLLDITNPAGQDWLGRKVTQLVQNYNIDGLYIDLGTSHELPEYYEFYEPLSCPDDYKEIFLRTLRNLNVVHIIGVNGAIKLPKLPTFVTLSPTESSWKGLQSIIPNVLTVGVGGFPFINPGIIGGDHKKTAMEKVSTNESITPTALAKFLFNKPDRDLYIRWLELSHFLPVVQYTYLPSDYDQEVINIAKKLKLIRDETIYPSIKRAINKALTTGLPIIQPLWMSDPNDVTCLKIWDQFMIGGEILVAPILSNNATEREIYLPKGRWKEHIGGGSTSTKGERWMHHYRIRQNQIAYFTRLLDPV